MMKRLFSVILCVLVQLALQPMLPGGSTVFAQMLSGHAVLLSTSGRVDASLKKDIVGAGARVDVSYEPLLIVRLLPGSSEKLLTHIPGVVLLRSRDDCDAIVESIPSHIRNVLWHLLPGSDGTRDAVELQRNACAGILPEQELDATALRVLLKSPAAGVDTDPAVTSDVMVGSSTVAVFCVSNVNAQQQGVPDWTDELHGTSMASILANLAWWSEMAASYGKEKSFRIREYGPTHPACAIAFDPTEGYETGEAWELDRRYQQPIMNALGYNAANTTLNMRAFCHDLRTVEGTDWAYAAFLLAGKNTVRGHAFIGGPATVMSASQLGAGLLFAHETGHIYHALDEYFEHGTSNRRARQSRFGVPNGNHHFRNHPVQPALMVHGYPALSSHAAVHVGLMDTVRLTTVSTVPEDATYEVAYLDADGAVVESSRCQGTLHFAWGNGTRVRLRALPAIEHEGRRYDNPAWDQSGTTQLTLEVDSTAPPMLTLRYQGTTVEEPFSIEYLTLANALASEIVTDVLPTGERSVAFAGPKGIALWSDTDRVILDHPLGNGDAEYRQSLSIARGVDGTLYFSSHGGEVLGWKEGSISVLSGPDPDVTYRGVTVAEDGAVWATDAAVISGRLLPAAVLHRFHDGQVTTFDPGSAPLTSQSISSIAPADGSRIWIAFGGDVPRDRGLFLFDPERMTIEDMSGRLPSPQVMRLRAVGDDSLLVIMKGIDSTRIERFVTLLHGAKESHWGASYFRTSGALFDGTFDGEGRLVVATTLGVAVLDKNDEWIRFRTANSEIVSDVCYAVAVAPDGTILAGTNNGAVRIAEHTASTSISPATAVPPTAEIRGIHPHPMRETGSVSVFFPRSMHADIYVSDMLGRVVSHLAGGQFSAGIHDIALPVIGTAGVYVVSCVTAAAMSSTLLQVLR